MRGNSECAQEQHWPLQVDWRGAGRHSEMGLTLRRSARQEVITATNLGRRRAAKGMLGSFCSPKHDSAHSTRRGRN